MHGTDKANDPATKLIQLKLGYPNSFVLRVLFCVQTSESEVVAKISLLNSPNYSLVFDRSHNTSQQNKKQQNTTNMLV